MSPKTAEHLDLILIWMAAPAQTLFIVLYAPTRWWTQLIGSALFTSSLALALLLDLTLISRYWRELPMWVGPAVFVIVTMGAYLKLAALVALRIQRWLRKRKIALGLSLEEAWHE